MRESYAIFGHFLHRLHITPGHAAGRKSGGVSRTLTRSWVANHIEHAVSRPHFSADNPSPRSGDHFSLNSTQAGWSYSDGASRPVAFTLARASRGTNVWLLPRRELTRATKCLCGAASRSDLLPAGSSRQCSAYPRPFPLFRFNAAHVFPLPRLPDRLSRRLHDQPSGWFEGCTANRTVASKMARRSRRLHARCACSLRETDRRRDR